MLQISKPLRILCIFILIIVLLLAFFSSYDSSKIDNLAFVIAIAIDRGSNDNNLKISFQIAKPSSMSDSESSKSSTSTINTVETGSIGSAINLMNSYIEKQLNFSHCKLIVFSEAIASDGISEEIYTLMNNVQIRPTTTIVISKVDAKYYIEKSKTTLESLPTKYYDVFPKSSKFTGYSTNSTIGDFFNSLNASTYEPSGILGGVISSEEDKIKEYSPQYILDYGNMKSNQSAISGDRGAENIGLAVFKNDKLVGELNAIETVCYSIIADSVNGFFITISDPENQETFIDLYLSVNHAIKKKVYIINETPYIVLDCKFSGRIYSMKDNSNYLDDSRLKSISASASKYLELQMYNYLYKTTKHYKSDINGFGKYALLNFSTIKDLEKYNWLENYQNSFFKVNCDVSVKSGYLITQT